LFTKNLKKSAFCSAAYADWADLIDEYDVTGKALLRVAQKPEQSLRFCSSFGHDREVRGGIDWRTLPTDDAHTWEENPLFMWVNAHVSLQRR
jgi:hypothetical protein